MIGLRLCRASLLRAALNSSSHETASSGASSSKNSIFNKFNCKNGQFLVYVAARNFEQDRKLAEMSSPDVMLGKWRLVKSENFDEYLKACGAGMVSRGMAATESTAGTWCVEIKKLSDDMFHLKTSTATKSAEISFKLDGKEVEEVTGDGRRCMTTMEWDDGTLIQKRKGLDGAKGGKLTRKFKGDEMEMHCEVDDVKCTRIYHRDESCRV